LRRRSVVRKLRKPWQSKSLKRKTGGKKRRGKEWRPRSAGKRRRRSVRWQRERPISRKKKKRKKGS